VVFNLKSGHILLVQEELSAVFSVDFFFDSGLSLRKELAWREEKPVLFREGTISLSPYPGNIFIIKRARPPSPINHCPPDAQICGISGDQYSF